MLHQRPVLPVTTHTATLPASYAPHQFLSKPELVQLRSAYASHFDLGNGRRLAVVGATPINYQDYQGNWQPIQPSFTEVEGGWRVIQNTLRSSFASDSTAFQVESGGQVFAWRPLALEMSDDDGHAWELAVPRSGSTVQARGRLPVTNIAFLVQQVGERLHYAHRQWTITRSKGIARSPCGRAGTTE
jgi:hypothetical protein